MSRLALLLCLALLPSGASAAVSGWSALLDKVRDEGEYRDDPGQHYYLERFTADTKGPHRAEYVVVEGGLGPDRKFHAGYARLVSEDWALQADGKTLITIWWFWLELDGTITRAQSHTQLRAAGEDRDKGVLRQRDVEITKEQAAAKRDEIVKFWTGAAQ